MDRRGLEVKTVTKLLMKIQGIWKKIQNALKRNRFSKKGGKLVSIFLTAGLCQLTFVLNKL